MSTDATAELSRAARWAVLAAAFAGLLVLDVSQDPPRLVGGVDTPGEVRSLAIGREGVYLADAFGYGSPLRVAPFQCSTWSGTPAAALVNDSGQAIGRTASQIVCEFRVVGPNPFRERMRMSWTVDRAHSARVAVYDVTGRLVQTLHDGPVGVGSHALEWDGRDREGRETTSGTYFVRTSSGPEETIRIVHIR